jgi:hypothetical protein
MRMYLPPHLPAPDEHTLKEWEMRDQRIVDLEEEVREALATNHASFATFFSSHRGYVPYGQSGNLIELLPADKVLQLCEIGVSMIEQGKYIPDIWQLDELAECITKLGASVPAMAMRAAALLARLEPHYSRLSQSVRFHLGLQPEEYYDRLLER